MAVPLTAAFRLNFAYTVQGLTHSLRMYCKAQVALTDNSGYGVLARDDSTIIGATDAAQGVWDGIRPFFSAAVLPPQVTVQARVLTQWNPVATPIVTGNGSAGGGSSPASQLTITLRTVTFDHLRVLVLEALGAIPAKYTGVIPFSLAYPSLGTLWGSTAPSNGPYHWQVGRDNQHVQAGQAFVSAATDLNDKVRRARGLV